MGSSEGKTTVALPPGFAAFVVLSGIVFVLFLAATAALAFAGPAIINPASGTHAAARMDAAFARALYRGGRDAEDGKRDDFAVRRYRQALDHVFADGAEERACTFALGAALAREGRYAEAVDLYRLLRKEDFTETAQLESYAQALVRSEDTSPDIDAIAKQWMTIAQRVGDASSESRASVLLGKRLEAAGHSDKAKRYFLGGAALDPMGPAAYDCAEFLDRQGETDAALRKLEPLLVAGESNRQAKELKQRAQALMAKIAARSTRTVESPPYRRLTIDDSAVPQRQS